MHDLRAELQESIDEAEWNWLEPHSQRDSLIVVTAGLSLVDVGYAIANDETLHVQHWIEEALIQKPSAAQLQAWGHDRGKRFKALIVQPYVLVQEMN